MSSKKTLHQQMRRFFVNGALVTLLDFIILNALVAFGTWFLLANVISTSVAVIASYKINKHWVFQSDTRMHTFIVFAGVTLFGSYVLQGSILYLFHEYASNIGYTAQNVLQTFGIQSISAEFLLLNISKICATFATAIWNFILYKKVVFKHAAA